MSTNQETQAENKTEKRIVGLAERITTPNSLRTTNTDAQKKTKSQVEVLFGVVGRWVVGGESEKVGTRQEKLEGSSG